MSRELDAWEAQKWLIHIASETPVELLLEAQRSAKA